MALCMLTMELLLLIDGLDLYFFFSHIKSHVPTAASALNCYYKYQLVHAGR
jgi:uncharacterized protein YybS (DUF2232 family)